jgi:SAM-dependent methyltransferase
VGVLQRVLRGLDFTFSGSRIPERVLLGLLGAYYASRFRWQWRWSSAEEAPHFYDHRMGVFDFAYGKSSSGPYPYFRAYHASEVIRDGDCVLDIGCGDGFFTRRFFAARSRQVDGLDVEPSAIAAARSLNGAPNVRYHLLDATSAPWPEARYDVVVWDGALGHFAPATTDAMMERIRATIGEEGIFVGSESLGHEGGDHLQFFESLDDLRRLLERHFPVVALREEHYPIAGGTVGRREAYWRCARKADRLTGSEWDRGPARQRPEGAVPSEGRR